MRRLILFAFVALCLALTCGHARAAAGDPQVKTDDLWYPGELAFSTFDRLAKTQARVYARVTGKPVATDEDKALASWLWRNAHFAHGEEGCGNYFGTGYKDGGWNREYWHGLFAHGFGLCGTTHSQWSAEVQVLLGPCRGRVVGVSGHNSFEVWLTGGAYGDGRWALLDHDISTVIYDDAGERLLSIAEVMADLNKYKDPYFRPQRQHGWRVAGLHDGDAGAYSSFRTVEYNGGYAGPPPTVHLRRGEALRRYLEPGLAGGKTFVFWGRNYTSRGVPGPARDRSWVNQPEKMFNSKNGTGWMEGRVRFANAVYTYTPNFKDGSYRQGVIDAGDDHVTFEFYSPYVIAATPVGNGPWSVYEKGGTNGLVIHGKADCPVAVSIDQGRTWHDAGSAHDGLDLTDAVKGGNQYWLRFGAAAKALAGAGLTIRTVCQANVAVIPRLHDGVNRVTYFASGRAITSAGPNLDQAAAHVVDGKIGSANVTLELKPPRGERAVTAYAASWNLSAAPPSPTTYRIDYSADGGKSWRPIVKDWRIIQRPPEPGDWWSQSFTFGGADVEPTRDAVRLRFTNDGRRSYRKVEGHLLYEVADPTPVTVTFAWRQGEAGPVKTTSHEYPAHTAAEDATWSFDPGADVRTVWVEYSAR